MMMRVKKLLSLKDYATNIMKSIPLKNVVNQKFFFFIIGVNQKMNIFCSIHIINGL